MKRPRNLIATTLLLSTTTTPSVFASLSFDSLRPRNLLSSSSPSSSSFASTSNTTTHTNPDQPQLVTPTPHQGRFGHSAIYFPPTTSSSSSSESPPPPSNEIWFIGGQLGTNGTQVTSQVLKFRVGSSFLWGDDRDPMSAIPDNPTDSSMDGMGFEATAFAASEIDDVGNPWIVGGITTDCSIDSIVQTFNYNNTSSSSSNSSWTSISFSPRTPPRRRQAQAISVTNSTTQGSDLWVFGGIAEPLTTCSSSTGGGETVGYIGLDRYSLSSSLSPDTVESIPWNRPVNASTTWIAPVSDYTASLLDDGTSIVVVGGQSADGQLAEMDEALVFNVDFREWYTKSIVGETPTSRMGHTAVSLSTGSILIHGGLSSNHTPLSDLYLLTPPPVTSLSEFSTSSTPWRWSRLEISNDSMTSPSLAWHTSTLIVGETIVVAFGIDTVEGEPSHQFWFLTVDETEGTYSWKDTFGGNQEEVELYLQALEEENQQVGGTSSSNGKRLRKRLSVESIRRDVEGNKSMVKRVEVIVNPKAHSTRISSTSSTVQVIPQATSGGGGGGGSSSSQTGLNEEQDGSSQESTSSNMNPSSPSSIIVIPSSPTSVPTSSSKQANSSNDSSSSSTSKSTAIGASIGAIGGAIALVGVAFVILRRRAASKKNFAGSTTPNMSSHSNFNDHHNGGRNGGEAPLVSTLMYTRPVQRRMLSLGSTISVLPSPRSEDGTIRLNDNNHEEDDTPRTTSQDPFSDDYNVNELGQLERSNTTTTTTASRKNIGEVLTSSVKSIPFLSTISRNHDDPSSPSTTSTSGGGDVYTSPAPTLLQSRRSLRISSVVPPGTPAELIGLAVTSDDGHDQQQPTTSTRSKSIQKGGGGGGGSMEPWETHFLQQHQPPSRPLSSGSNVAAVNGGGGDGIPAILRPGTPLRVSNPDPFADQ